MTGMRAVIFDVAETFIFSERCGSFSRRGFVVCRWRLCVVRCWELRRLDAFLAVQVHLLLIHVSTERRYSYSTYVYSYRQMGLCCPMMIVAEACKARRRTRCYVFVCRMLVLSKLRESFRANPTQTSLLFASDT